MVDPEGVTGDQRVVVVNGPAGVGKTTVGRLLAGRSANGACIEGDALAGFIVTRERGAVAQGLGYEHGATLASNFVGAGYELVVFEYCFEEGAQVQRFLRAYTAAAPVFVFTLWAPLPVVLERERTRAERPRLGDRVVECYRSMERGLTELGQVIESTDAPAAVAARIDALSRGGWALRGGIAGHLAVRAAAIWPDAGMCHLAHSACVIWPDAGMCHLAHSACANCPTGVRHLAPRACAIWPCRRPRPYTGRMGRTYRADAIVLRSMRFGEADRILHLYTAERGRVNAIAKGVRKTTSRFGGRLEPLTRAALMLHEGRGELHTVSGADIVSAHSAVRERPYPLAVALIGAEAVLKLHPEPERQPRVFEGLVRFLDLLDGPMPDAGRPAQDGLAVGFQLKLLLLAGYLPHLTSCASCGRDGPLIGYSAAAGGAVCEFCSGDADGFGLRPGSLEAIEGLIERPLRPGPLEPAAAADAVRVVETTYAHHGGFRMRTLQA
ncbi:MAG TPA: DNA repair protein RecO [Gaiellales bacterium]